MRAMRSSASLPVVRIQTPPADIEQELPVGKRTRIAPPGRSPSNVQQAKGVHHVLAS